MNARFPTRIRQRVAVVIGTRPEAIKMWPVVRALRAHEEIETLVWSTGQHRELLQTTMQSLQFSADVDLAVMDRATDLASITSAVVEGISRLIRETRPDRVLVHGDTTTAFAASLAAFYEHTPVAHVEAGLRTHDLDRPWPEEGNRAMIARLADMHFAPTVEARNNLVREAVARHRIFVTGNTVIDALKTVVGNLLTDPVYAGKTAAELPKLDPDRQTVLVTGHRRESLGSGLENVFAAIAKLSREKAVNVVFPVHLNPEVRASAERVLSDCAHVHLIEPVDYPQLVWLMMHSDLVVTDSGGIQEEAPALGKQILVTRETTERPEALKSGLVKLVGTDPNLIYSESVRGLEAATKTACIGLQASPYGDGLAGLRIADLVSQKTETVAEFLFDSGRRLSQTV